MKSLQTEFAAHIRNPDKNQRPDGIEDRRMAIYRDLFYSNIQGFIENGFPVLRSLYSDGDWHALVRHFISDYRCASPYFLKISEEFLAFLSSEVYQPTPADPPFMRELAHYEWVELALSVAPDPQADAHIDTNGDLMASPPLLSPLAWNLSYQWPVERISASYQPEKPPETPTHIVVYRDRRDRVRFVSITPVTAALLQLMDAHPQATGRELCEAIAEHLGQDPEHLKQAGEQALESLREKGIILGAKVR
ncbi:conserved hypothetical protein [gamma proteobacterium HTCC5015]|nr:conserved hypothetical protein [gamma proteobacterium HTCC5015]